MRRVYWRDVVKGVKIGINYDAEKRETGDLHNAMRLKSHLTPSLWRVQQCEWFKDKRHACAGNKLCPNRSRENCTIWRLDKDRLRNHIYMRGDRRCYMSIPRSGIGCQWCPFALPCLIMLWFEGCEKNQ